MGINSNDGGKQMVTNSPYTDLLVTVKCSVPLPVSLYHLSYTARQLTSHTTTE